MNSQANLKQILCISREIVQSVVAEFTKMLKTLTLTPQIKSVVFPQKALVVLGLYDVCNEKNTD